MNLEKLFSMQRELDEHIMTEHPEMRGQNNLDWKILALQVELGECANEWRGFKKWSKDQNPRLETKCHACNGLGSFPDVGETITIDGVVTGYYEPCLYCEGTGIERKPLLEEYVDCLHFILSIGLELKLQELKINPLENEFTSVLEAFQHSFNWSVNLNYVLFDEPFSSEYRIERTYFNLISVFVTLGELLGFTWEQVEEAYFAKNVVNHERQDNNY
jgi:dimeric dUTPase (all-alpha-NTP-PPase superfamily)